MQRAIGARKKLREKRIPLHILARYMGISRETLSRKLFGRQPILLSEAFIIQGVLNSDLTLDELFPEEKKKQSVTLCSIGRTI